MTHMFFSFKFKKYELKSLLSCRCLSGMLVSYYRWSGINHSPNIAVMVMSTSMQSSALHKEEKGDGSFYESLSLEADLEMRRQKLCQVGRVGEG